MTLTATDAIIFFGFIAIVVAVSLFASRGERTSEDYFLAGRKLTWPLIGLSLIASNISTEHFVGMTGAAFGPQGLAVANWEWLAAVALVFVGWWLLPTFLKAGIYTMPQFLEHRFDVNARTIMAIYMLIAYIVVLLAVVLFSGSIALDAIFGLDEQFAGWFGLSMEENAPWHQRADFWSTVAAIWAIGLVAGAYTAWGGLIAVVWSDLLQGAVLIIGGTIVTVLALNQLGDGSTVTGWNTLLERSQDQMHLLRPADDDALPWTTLIAGIWIPFLFYWGLNQFITQRTLGARSVAEGQRGVMFAALIKVWLPFVVVLPGVIAFHLVGDRVETADEAYPLLLVEILPPWLRAIMLAAIAGAIMSTFNSGLNSASTVFSIDIYKRWLKPDADDRSLVRVGRITTIVVIVLGCLWAPVVGSFESVFAYIQEVWLYVSPAIVAVFLVGLIVPLAPPAAATTAMLLGPVLYGIARLGHHVVPAMEPFGDWHFLHHATIVLALLIALMVGWTLIQRLPERRVFPKTDIDTRTPVDVWIAGSIVIGLVGVLYLMFP
jgi:SSS family solute:Na+ symporter